MTSKSDQFQISPAASPETLQHTVWRTWLLIANSDENHYTTNSHYLTYTFILKGRENVLCGLGSERANIIRAKREEKEPSFSVLSVPSYPERGGGRERTLGTRVGKRPLDEGCEHRWPTFWNWPATCNPDPTHQNGRCGTEKTPGDW